LGDEFTVSLAQKTGVEVQQALATAWKAANGVCGKRLVPFIPELIPTVDRHGHLSLNLSGRASEPEN
jgi:hypothetical protein